MDATTAPANKASRTAAVKRAIRAAGLDPVEIRTHHVAGGCITTLYGVTEANGAAYADVLDALGWSDGPTDRSHFGSGFVSLYVKS